MRSEQIISASELSIPRDGFPWLAGILNGNFDENLLLFSGPFAMTGDQPETDSLQDILNAGQFSHATDGIVTICALTMYRDHQSLCESVWNH